MPFFCIAVTDTPHLYKKLGFILDLLWEDSRIPLLFKYNLDAEHKLYVIAKQFIFPISQAPVTR